MKKLAGFLAVWRIIAFCIILAVTGYVLWKDIYTWHLFQESYYQYTSEPSRLGFTSGWSPAYSYLLTCLTLAIASASFLYDRRNLSLTRIVTENVFFFLVLYLMWVISNSIYLILEPNHSGPFL